MLGSSLDILFLYIIFIFKEIGASELTFELPDSAKECFHEKLKIGSKFSLQFQVCYRNLMLYYF